VGAAWDSFEAQKNLTRTDPGQQLTLSGNRYNIYASAIDALRTEPLRGVGAGGFEFWWNVDARDPEFIRDAHSLYLETGAELGIVGLLALLALVVGGAIAAVRARRRARDDDAAIATVALTATATVFLVHAGVDPWPPPCDCAGDSSPSRSG
jgi:O-antigen ligase